MNIRCSKRCAKPVRPSFSSPEPTWYQTFVVTTGTEWSSWMMTVRPLGRVSTVAGAGRGGRCAGRGAGGGGGRGSVVRGLCAAADGGGRWRGEGARRLVSGVPARGCGRGVSIVPVAVGAERGGAAG